MTQVLPNTKRTLAMTRVAVLVSDTPEFLIELMIQYKVFVPAKAPVRI